MKKKPTKKRPVKKVAKDRVTVELRVGKAVVKQWLYVVYDKTRVGAAPKLTRIQAALKKRGLKRSDLEFRLDGCKVFRDDVFLQGDKRLTISKRPRPKAGKVPRQLLEVRIHAPGIDPMNVGLYDDVKIKDVIALKPITSALEKLGWNREGEELVFNLDGEDCTENELISMLNAVLTIAHRPSVTGEQHGTGHQTPGKQPFDIVIHVEDSGGKLVAAHSRAIDRDTSIRDLLETQDIKADLKSHGWTVDDVEAFVNGAQRRLLDDVLIDTDKVITISPKRPAQS